ncbi:MAG: GMC family oxidoreductase [Gammaproteobacteria bacterium]
MIEDARRLPEDTLIETDLAIIGAGAAGITIARELAGTDLRICLLESGGLEFEQDTQNLYNGENGGRWYFPLDKCRLRYFGGSTNHWGGWCRPLTPIDFEARDWVPYSGWPITRADLDPYYERAQPVTETGPFRYDATSFWEEQIGARMLPLSLGLITTTFFQYSPPTRFGTRYRKDIEQAANVRALLHATVTEIETSETGAEVTGLRVATLGGPSFRVSARRYILATGAIENPRLLLLSNRSQPAGVGNTHDLVGRFFMEHPHVPGVAGMVTSRPEAFNAAYTQHLSLADSIVHSALIPTDALLRRERLQQAVFTIGVLGVYTAENLASKTPADQQRARDIFNLQRDLDPPRTTDHPPAGYNDWPPAGALGASCAFGCACEQAPNPDSRVTLSDERDALGLPRARLDWRLSEADKLSLNRIVRAVAEEFGAQSLGRVQPALSDDGNWPEETIGGYHHMGTTRMADSPELGVVDANCKVHGVANLYIAGSSVFTTGGASNPTLTIVALALRLADHLRKQSS